ncbi:MAG TPA: glycosyl hydrolase family 18 protein [Bacilli bacterium]|nr:glycosyl hydrolase family 18 protein [Bacilli bacterium]
MLYFNGGSEVDYPTTFAENEEVILPTSSVKNGYTFGGWYDNSSFTGSQIEVVPSGTTSDVTLYAKWNIVNYLISYQLNGGSIGSPYPSSYTINDEITLPIPSYTQYVFQGWYDNADFLGNSISSIVLGTTGNKNYHAKWRVIDADDFRLFMESSLPAVVEEDLELPSTYEGLSISWSSNKPTVMSNTGVYSRPYLATTVILTASVSGAFGSATQDYEVDLKGFKVLSPGIASSYIYRGYNTVTQAFFDTLDIINCAFITADANGTLSGSTFLTNVSTHIIPKAHEQGDWVIVSISPSSSWSAIAANSTIVNTFANNIVSLINTYGFDGVDIDWETPSVGEEALFTAMMAVIYQKVKANNPHHLVTAAIAAGMWQPPRYDLNNSKQYLDFINMMAYDMASSSGYYQNALYRQTTFHNSTMSVGKTLNSCSINESVAFYVNNYAISKAKIIVGIPFYGVRQTRTYSEGTWSAWSKASTPYYHTIVANYIGNADYTEYYDSGAQVPYLVKNDGTEFISYDNPTSVAVKCQYVIDNQIGGIMYWENGCDNTGALLASMKSALNK